MGIKMDINSVNKGKESKLHFTIAFRPLKLIIGKDTVINPFSGGTLIIDEFPFIRVTGNRRKQAEIVGEA